MTGEPYYAYGHIKKATFKNSHQPPNLPNLCMSSDHGLMGSFQFLEKQFLALNAPGTLDGNEAFHEVSDNRIKKHPTVQRGALL